MPRRTPNKTATITDIECRDDRGAVTVGNEAAV
jgi:hypothetical protein